MKQIEIQVMTYIRANVPDDYEPQLGLSVEDGCASLWLRHNQEAEIVDMWFEKGEIINEEDILD